MNKIGKIFSKNWVAVIMGMALTLFVLFAMGYILNGFYPDKYKFDLNICSQGIIAILGGIGTGGINHFINSKYNSKIGEKPEED